ncbi:MAG: HEPN domain-containing protein [Bacteroidales bacterium]|nr:HEPN domain-containing protein [Bacteroidales bacterium]
MTALTEQNRIDIVRYRIENANQTLAEVETHKANGYYNTAVNRMYYACYYAASALLIAYGIETKSHDGVRQQLGKQMVLTGKLPAELGKFYSQLFSKRTAADYEDFICQDLETVEELLPTAQLFVNTIEQMTNDWMASYV